MGLDYALVHLKYTIPPALALTFVYWPLFTKLDIYRVSFLITIAVLSTIPWDSYLIRNRIWTYPDYAVLGPTVYRIPIEELFFFFIQTYNTSLLYLCISKPTFYPVYLAHESIQSAQESVLVKYARFFGIVGQLCLVWAIVFAAQLIKKWGVGTYMGLIIIWAFPFLLLLWTLSHQFLLRIPKLNLVLPILLPTIYLWLVDTFALRRGTWVIETGTKYGIHVWNGLEIEEAFFFLATNVLIVLGLVAVDYVVAILDTFADLFPHVTTLPSPMATLKALWLPLTAYDGKRVVALDQALRRLQRKSRSFYLASAVFEGRLRIDLVLLYSFCRVADDLVDAVSTEEEAQDWVRKLRDFLDFAYLSVSSPSTKIDIEGYVTSRFPSEAQSALIQLPVSCLSPEPLYALLNGFEMDLKFPVKSQLSRISKWPIDSDADLRKYGGFVAGTVAELCLDLVFYHYPGSTTTEKIAHIKGAGAQMGVALQIINIARDIQVDAEMGRVYIPSTWLHAENMSSMDIIKEPRGSKVRHFRGKLLDMSFALYEEARGSIEELPAEVRGSMRVAVESYMEIGRVLQQESYQVKAGRATVPVLRRIMVAWKALRR